MKKKKRSEREEAPKAVVVTPSTEKKKKKKRQREELEERVSTAMKEEKTGTKKKRREGGEEEGGVYTAVDEQLKRTKKKRRKEEEESCSTAVDEEMKKKKKKKKVRLEGASLATATVTNCLETRKKNTTTATKGPNKQASKTRTSRKNKKEKEEEEEGVKEESTERDALLEELQEFVPDVKTRCADVVRKLLSYDLPRFRDFKKQGVILRLGRFTAVENTRIIKNVHDFMALTGIASAKKLLFPHRFKDEEAEIKKLKIQHRFLERIADGVPHSCHQVYMRSKKIFDEWNYLGRFSKDEVDSLVKFRHLHGNNWATISEKMERSSSALQKRFSMISSGRGPWVPDEESRLKEAVRDYLETLVQHNPSSGLRREQLCNNLPWNNISQHVETRSWTQCRLKWLSILKSKLSTRRSFTNRGPDVLRAKILLINTLYQMSIDDPAEVDWDEVAETVGEITSLCVQKRFHRLKVQVPNWTYLTYGEILDILQERVVPQLQEKLSKCASEGAEPRDERAGVREDAYQLSDIFTEADDIELDNS